MSVAGQALEQVPHGRRQTARRREAGLEALGFKGRRQLTEPEQRRDVLEGGVRGEVADLVAPVVEPAGLAVHSTDRRPPRDHVLEPRLPRRLHVDLLAIVD